MKREIRHHKTGFAMYYSLMALLEFLNQSLHDNLQNCKCKIRQLGKILAGPTLPHQYTCVSTLARSMSKRVCNLKALAA